MLRAALAVGALNAALALPGDEDIAERIAAFHAGENEAAGKPKPTKKYERIHHTQPGYQWNDAGGYCGSWSIQRAVMGKGAWISQQQVRDHALPGGGNDEEILATNMDDALAKLKLKAEGWDYAGLPTPQVEGYMKFLKKNLVAGHPIVWMIMQLGEKVPITQKPYNLTEVNGLYGHIEPVVGIMSNHPLSDETVYDDDIFVHYTDADKNTYYRTAKSLPSDWSEEHPSPSCSNALYSGGPCINKQRGYGWAIEGFVDEMEGMPLSLALDKWGSEPDTRDGGNAIELAGTLTATGLTAGSEYAIYRFDGVNDAFAYSDDKKIHTFTAADDTFVFQDPKTFSSSSATYYRCVSTSVGGVTV